MTEYNYARIEMAKAKYRNQIALIDRKISVLKSQSYHAHMQLVVIETLEDAGGEMTALELMTEVTKRTNDRINLPFDLCKLIGFEPDEIVSLVKKIEFEA